MVSRSMNVSSSDIKRSRISRRHLLAGLSGLALGTMLVASPLALADGHANLISAKDWAMVQDVAKGQTVYWHAWGGGDRINDYIAWIGDEVKKQYGVTLKHVKVSDTANVVSQVVAEKAAGKDKGGSVDLVWINGENFASMKEKGLLLPQAWAPDLPNYRYADIKGKPTLTTDFTVPTDGLESPWGMAQLSFYYDSAVTKDLPKSATALLDWAKKNPGRFAYPKPPDFIGSTFLKQIALELAPDATVLSKQVTEETYKAVSEKLFAYLDELNPVLWRKGKAFPENVTSLKTMLADSEIDIAFTFNPGSASSAIANNELPGSVRSFVFENGTIGNSHFVAIPYNANAKAGAFIVANFLLSPEAQARKQDPNVWGDPTVLNIASLKSEDKARFDTLDLGVATLKPEEFGQALPEPHASWMERIEKDWTKRYGAQ
ncbi:putative thiamine transport system substrate-binding protein [Cohaesibacter gelatinilyticus]|uniref:Putative thiamine transport system substrate-binding protein n=2 Tax=Cohaesibacter gelatinilyticus TaxID=372072 RepID=A0A285PKR5_9HYPH|nr:putative thiamine transport system substrate-binding protein [Cohaesibacter gelatinilyticus]